MNGNYNPNQYWQERGKNYTVSADTSIELMTLRYLLKILGKNDQKILEVGPGYGRIYNYLKEDLSIDLFHFTMCDFVKSMREECEARTGIKPDLWNGKKLPYSDNAFDWVISFSVMLHVPESNILKHFEETIRVADRYIYIATYYGPNKGLAKHCFSHDYDSMVDRFKLEVVYKRSFMDGLRVNWLLKKF